MRENYFDKQLNDVKKGEHGHFVRVQSISMALIGIAATLIIEGIYFEGWEKYMHGVLIKGCIIIGLVVVMAELQYWLYGKLLRATCWTRTLKIQNALIRGALSWGVFCAVITTQTKSWIYVVVSLVVWSILGFCMHLGKGSWDFNR